MIFLLYFSFELIKTIRNRPYASAPWTIISTPLKRAAENPEEAEMANQAVAHDSIWLYSELGNEFLRRKLIERRKINSGSLASIFASNVLRRHSREGVRKTSLRWSRSSHLWVGATLSLHGGSGAARDGVASFELSEGQPVRDPGRPESGTSKRKLRLKTVETSHTAYKHRWKRSLRELAARMMIKIRIIGMFETFSKKTFSENSKELESK